MSSPRVRPVDPPYSDELQSAFDIVMPAGAPPLDLFRTVGRNPRVLSRMVRGGLLDKGSVTLADRELVILRACARCGAEYEWGVHAAVFADKAGFSGEQLSDSCAELVNPGLWSPRQRLLLAMVDALHADADIDDRLWGALAEQYEEAQLIELVMLAGLYHAVSFMVNALRLENEPFASGFPE